MQRVYASGLLLGAGVLTFRTMRLMLVEGAFERLAVWVLALLVLEALIDVACAAFTVRWIVSGRSSDDSLPLRLGAAATILHAIRVLIFALGNGGPLKNFDKSPAYVTAPGLDPFWVWFASVLSVIGVIAVAIIWRIRRARGSAGSR